ncbi:uncharacterized protein LOC109838792 [Asparagus officinalis]|uniref:uncharacterized protein LOC109838792 n=1 Tax=Asparagus officinalis TaxID=4686 RepID=UPI00098DFFC9|nr:uncharacterized protein LOC109838792 [Asparagus officinalis]
MFLHSSSRLCVRSRSGPSINVEDAPVNPVVSTTAAVTVNASIEIKTILNTSSKAEANPSTVVETKTTMDATVIGARIDHDVVVGTEAEATASVMPTISIASTKILDPGLNVVIAAPTTLITATATVATTIFTSSLVFTETMASSTGQSEVYLQQRDDSLFELDRQLLEKKQRVKEIEGVGEKLSSENRKIANVERNKQRQTKSYKTMLADLQTKLEEAEEELKGMRKCGKH